MPRAYIRTAFVLIVFTVFLLFLMGRPLVYEDGPIKLWTPNSQSRETSQQISDPYTFTHVEHGILLYLGTSLFSSHVSFGGRFLIAVALESGWEILENTPFVIGRYRTETISLDYYGDSVINTLGDILAAILGFFIARRFSWRQNILILCLIELGLYFWIGDGLFMNIVQLV